MPVRNRTGAPPPATTARSARSTRTSRAGAAAPAADATKAAPDVFLKDHVLGFDDKKQASEETQQARAERFLEVLRTPSEGKLTFGGKLTVGGVDREASLRSYYPSLKVAQQLASDPALGQGVAAFVEHDVGVPDDLRELAAKAVDATGNLGEPAKALGRAKYDQALWGTIHQLLSSNGQQPDLAAMKLDDASCAQCV